MLRHVVMFKFKETTPREKIAEIEKAFCALSGEIPVIHDFEWGTDISVEGKNNGFTHCFLVSFLTEKDRDAYLIHPAHKAFSNFLRKNLDRVLVLDYRLRPTE